MITVNALGEACPMPVVKAKKAIDALTAPETVQVLVDNDAAVQNLIRLAGQYGFAVRAEKQGEAQFSVTIDAAGAKKYVADEAVVCAPLKQGEKNIVVAISKDHMGEGEEALGKTLLKAFIFALTQQDALPKTILFYNSGAFVTSTEGPSIEDLLFHSYDPDLHETERHNQVVQCPGILEMVLFGIFQSLSHHCCHHRSDNSDALVPAHRYSLPARYPALSPPFLFLAAVLISVSAMQ